MGLTSLSEDIERRRYESTYESYYAPSRRERAFSTSMEMWANERDDICNTDETPVLTRAVDCANITAHELKKCPTCGQGMALAELVEHAFWSHGRCAKWDRFSAFFRPMVKPGIAGALEMLEICRIHRRERIRFLEQKRVDAVRRAFRLLRC